MQLELDISVACPDWLTDLPEAEALARRAAEAALARAAAGETRPLELAIVLSDDATVRALNRQWRGRDTPTNVLSFEGGEAPPPGSGRPWLLGDVVLAHGTVLREAAEQDKTPADHLSHLVVHGVLHLLGFDHENEAEAEAMEGLEVAVLTGLGIADPYRPPDLSDSENETEMEVVKARR